MARRVRRGVKVRRVVRRFELWSVAKMALIFHLFCFALTVGVLVVLWNVAFRLGTVTKLETFLSDFGFSDKVTKQDFRLHGDALFRAGTLVGLGLVALNTLGTVMLAFFYNGVSGMFGGVVVSVLEERPPMSPAERRAVVADGRGTRLALPAGPVDAGVPSGRRARRKGLRAAEAAAKAEEAARRMAESPLAVPSATPAPAPARKRKAKLQKAKRDDRAELVEAGSASTVIPPPAAEAVQVVTVSSAEKALKPRNGTARKKKTKPVVAADDDAPSGRVAAHWASADDAAIASGDEELLATSEVAAAAPGPAS